MSTVDSSVRCPQCGRWACQTFDCKVSSWDIGCNHCGYSRYMGPAYASDGQLKEKWIDEALPVYGVIAIQSPGPFAVITVLRCASEQEFARCLAHFDQIKEPYRWAQVTKWNAERRENEIVRLYLEDGHTAPNLYPCDDEEAARDETDQVEGEAP